MVNKKLIKRFSLIIGVLLIPTFVVGGYFILNGSDPYKNYWRAPIFDSPQGFVETYKASVDSGTEVLILPGFSHKSGIQEAYSSNFNTFKNVGTIFIDDNLKVDLKDQTAIERVSSISYRTDIGSFQTGISAAWLLNQNQDYFGDELTYGAWGGANFSSVISFLGGFQRGINWFNKIAIPILNSSNIKPTSGGGKEFIPVEQIKGVAGGDISGSFAEGVGNEFAKSYLNKNADLLFPVAGSQIWAAQSEILSRKAKCILIGVDSEAEKDPRNKFGIAAGANKVGNGKIVQFSSVKKLDFTIFKMLVIINNGNILPTQNELDKMEFPPGFNKVSDYNGFVNSQNIGGFGTHSIGDYENGLVGASGDGVTYYNKIIHLVNKNPLETIDFDNPNYMFYVGSEGEKILYSRLQIKFIDYANEKDSTGSLIFKNFETLKKNGFITKGDQNEKKTLKIIVSTPTSVLIDGSFSQSSYVGIYIYFKAMGIHIPELHG